MKGVVLGVLIMAPWLLVRVPHDNGGEATDLMARESRREQGVRVLLSPSGETSQ
jgi:hypothetical protein